jgi:hypothetical protein
MPLSRPGLTMKSGSTSSGGHASAHVPEHVLVAFTSFRNA